MLRPFVALSLLAWLQVPSQAVPAQQPAQNYVPNAATAICIAEAVWLPIYGKGIYQQKPFVAVLKDNTVWVVQGSLPKGWDGGVPYIEISKQDGRILQVTHGK